MMAITAINSMSVNAGALRRVWVLMAMELVQDKNFVLMKSNLPEHRTQCKYNYFPLAVSLTGGSKQISEIPDIVTDFFVSIRFRIHFRSVGEAILSC